MHEVETGRLLWREAAGATYLEPAAARDHPWLRCGFTTRHGGSAGQGLNLSFDRGDRAAVLANRQHMLCALALDHTTLYSMRQVHGNRVCVVDADATHRGLRGVSADALVTTLPDAALGVLVADCLPIVLYTEAPRLIAVVHAGRMGTYHRIVSHVVETITRQFAVVPTQIHAVLGPAIGGCCYRLDSHAVEPFQSDSPDWETFFTPQENGCWTMSLTAANAAQLCAAGVPVAQIETVSPCTVCHHAHLYSHRAEGLTAGRGMAIIGMRRTDIC